MTWLAYRYTPAQVIQWLGRKPGSKRVLREPVPAGVRHVARDGLGGLGRSSSTTFQQANLDAIRKYPDHAVHRSLAARARLGLARATTIRRHEHDLRRVQLPGRRRARRARSRRTTGATTHLTDIKGPLHLPGDVARLDPAGPTLFYTTDNLAYRDLVALDVKTGKRQRAAEGRAHRRSRRSSRADRTLWGIRHLNGLCTLVRMAPPYHEWKRVVTFPYGTIVYDLDVSPDGTLLAASFGEINGKQNVRVIATDEAARGRRDARRRVRLRPERARQLRLLARRQVSVRQLVLHGRVEHLPLRARDEEARGGDERRDRLLPADSARRRRADRVPLHRRRASCRRASPRTPIQDVQSDHVPRRADDREASGAARPGRVGVTGRRAATTRCRRPRAPTGSAATSAASRSIRSSRATRTRPPSACAYNFSDPLSFNRANVSGVVLAGRRPARQRARALRARVSALRLARARGRATTPTSTICSGRRKVSRKGYSIGLGHTNTLIFDEPRRMTLEIEGARRRQSRPAAAVPERARARSIS